MENKTIVDGLKPYGLGEKLRTLTAEEKYGTGRTGQTHGVVAGDALEARKRKTVSHFADAAADRDGIRRRAGSFLHRRTQTPCLRIVRKNERMRFLERPAVWSPSISRVLISRQPNEN